MLLKIKIKIKKESPLSGVSSLKKRKVGKSLLSMTLGDYSEQNIKPHKHLKATVDRTMSVEAVKNPEDISWLSDYYLLKIYNDFLLSRGVSTISFEIDQLNKIFNISSRSKIISGTQRLRRIDLEGGKSAVLWAQVCDDYSRGLASKKLYVGITRKSLV